MSDTGIPCSYPLRPQPKPWCYICGNSCSDAGNKGHRVKWLGRSVRACLNCIEDNELELS